MLLITVFSFLLAVSAAPAVFKRDVNLDCTLVLTIYNTCLSGNSAEACVAPLSTAAQKCLPVTGIKRQDCASVEDLREYCVHELGSEANTAAIDDCVSVAQSTAGTCTPNAEPASGLTTGSDVKRQDDCDLDEIQQDCVNQLGPDTSDSSIEACVTQATDAKCVDDDLVPRLKRDDLTCDLASFDRTCTAKFTSHSDIKSCIQEFVTSTPSCAAVIAHWTALDKRDGVTCDIETIREDCEAGLGPDADVETCVQNTLETCGVR